MSDNIRREFQRLVLNFDCVENGDQRLAIILHDARNKITGIGPNLECCLIQSGPALISLARLLRLSHELAKESLDPAIDANECVSLMLKLRNQIWETLAYYDDELKFSDSSPDAEECLRDATTMAREFNKLVFEAKKHLQSAQNLGNEPVQSIDILDFVEPMLTSFKKRFPHINFRLEMQPGIKTFVYPLSFKCALENLILNSAEAMQKSGEVCIRANEEVLETEHGRFPGIKQGKYCVIEVEDNGPGITPSVLQRISEGKVTTKVGGSGIGLASVRNSVRTHRGHLIIESKEDEFTKVTTLLPSTIPPASGVVAKAGTTEDETEIAETG